MAKKYKTPKIEELIEAGVHFGHQIKSWNPNMMPYIYTTRKNIHVIDLEQTEVLIEKAADFLYEVAAKGGSIVFVGTKKQAREIIEIEAKRSGAMFVTERWLGGTITNFEVIRKNNIKKLIDLRKGREEGEFEMYTKKERLLIDREIEKLDTYVGGLTRLTRKPDALFVVDAKREKTAVREANRTKIPVVALIDTNSDPAGINYPIPGNDDAIKSIACVVKGLADAVEQGYKDYAEGVKEEEEKKEEEKKETGKEEVKKAESKKEKPKKKPAKKTEKKKTTTKKKTTKKKETKTSTKTKVKKEKK
jgi:small subunit ribosomal protein S2